MSRTGVVIGLFICLLGTAGCTLHSHAKHWHGRVGADGEPVYYVATTKIGFNVLIFISIPFLGDTSVDGMIDNLTEKIAERDGDHVRIVQGDSENYWYGWPPLTWIITPVVSTVTADYRPSKATLKKDRDSLEAD